MIKNNILKGVFLILLSALGSISAMGQELVSVKVMGKGKPMILIHGMSCSAEVWDEVADRYRDSYELHLVSLQGFGNGEFAVKEHFLEAVKDELIAYTRRSGLVKPVLMGHSMGGFLAYWAAAEEPDLFGSIVSVDGLPYFPAMQGPGITPETAKPMVDNMRKAMEQMDDEGYKNYQIQTVAGMVTAPDKREKVVEMGLASNKQVVGQAFGEMYTTDLRPLLKDIKVPVLVLGSWYGYKDYGVNKEMVQRGIEGQVSGIPNATVAVADKALHFIFYDETEWFFEQVDGFLQQ